MQEQEQAPPAFRSPLPLFQPASIAIVGASERAKWPTQIYQQLRQHGFPGPIYPVNPRSSEVWGLKCYADLASLPQPPAHALVIVPAPAVQGVLETGVAADLKSATVYAAQLGEGSDPEIVARGLALKELIQRSGLVLCGPNCMGFNAVREKNFGYPNADLCTMTPGAVAFVTQSGGTVQYIGTMGAHRGVRFNYLISSGNELSLDLADYVNHFAEDDSTRVIALFVEGIRRPQAFMTAAQKALAAGKPIIAIKTGKSQKARDSAQSHTGAIAGDYGAFTAMCERYGVVICHTLDDMVEMLLAFQYGRYPKGSRVGWMTTSGGTVDLLFDHLEEIGAVSAPEFDARTKAALRPLVSAELALKNPLDAGNPVSDAHDAKLCAVVASDPNIDMLAWGGTPPSGSRLRDPAVTRSIAESTDKPVIGFIRMGILTDQATVKFQDEVGFPFLQGLPAVIRTLGALAFYGARKGRSIPALPAPTGRADNLIGAALDAALNRHGLTLPRSAMAKSPQEAGAAAAAIGFPVALKIVSSAISHKTEVGGVRLHLASQAEVERAAHALAAAAAQGAPGAPVEGFLVQEMVEGVEMIVGARTDALYGPTLVVGAGGILVELVRDVVFRLLPITPEDVRAMIGELKAAKLLAGFRGRPAADVEALIKAICGLSEFYLDHRHLISDIEINPLIVRPGGVRAVDVRLVRPGTH